MAGGRVLSLAIVLLISSLTHHARGQLCLPGPTGITHFNHLCDKTFADANATGFFPVVLDRVQGVNGDVAPVEWAMTLASVPNTAIEASIWYNTGGANYTNDIQLGYDVCYLQINGLTPQAQYNGQQDTGNCYSALDEQCATEIEDLATQKAMLLVDNPTLGPSSNLTGNVEQICVDIGNAIKDELPTRCHQYFTSDPSIVNGLAIESPLALTDFNNTNPSGTCIDNSEDGCTIHGSQGTFWAAGGYYLAVKQNESAKAVHQTYDFAAQAVFPSLLVFFPPDTIHRLDVPQTESHLRCLRVDHFNEGSRIPPPMPEPPSTSHGGLSGGAIAGIVVGSVAGAALLLGAAVFLFCRRRRRKTKAQLLESEANELEGDAARRELSDDAAVAEAGDATKRAELSPEQEKKVELPSGGEVHEMWVEDLPIPELEESGFGSGGGEKQDGTKEAKGGVS